jgi:hypothetical protein
MTIPYLRLPPLSRTHVHLLGITVCPQLEQRNHPECGRNRCCRALEARQRTRLRSGREALQRNRLSGRAQIQWRCRTGAVHRKAPGSRELISATDPATHPALGKLYRRERAAVEGFHSRAQDDHGLNDLRSRGLVRAQCHLDMSCTPRDPDIHRLGAKRVCLPHFRRRLRGRVILSP